jgi:hypothetical protein
MKEKGRLKKWLKDNGRNALGNVLDTIGENTSIPIASKLIEGIGESLMDDKEISEEDKKEIAEMIEFELKELEILESNLTERHKNDMQSDSWMSKNVRPIILLFSWLLLTIMMIFAWFNKSLPSNYVSLFETLSLAVTGGYFALRTVEKRNEKKYNN